MQILAGTYTRDSGVIALEGVEEELGSKLVKELSESYQLVILSDHAREWIEYILDYHQFLDIFSIKIFSYELGSVKSESETFENALSVIKIPPWQCLFVDDNQFNIATAKMAGLFGLHFTHTDAFIDTLRQRNFLGAPALNNAIGFGNSAASSFNHSP